jgi:hypothetical protein
MLGPYEEGHFTAKGQSTQRFAGGEAQHALEGIDARRSICQHHSMLARLLLILVLSVALPVRGYAASLMMLCGGQGSGAMVSSGAMPAAHDHGHHAAAADHAPDADHHASQTDTTADPSGDHDHHATSCSACGVCCAGVVSSLSHDFLILGMDSSGPIAFFDRSFAGFIPSGLDRPPRALLR